MQNSCSEKETCCVALKTQFHETFEMLGCKRLASIKRAQVHQCAPSWKYCKQEAGSCGPNTWRAFPSNSTRYRCWKWMRISNQKCSVSNSELIQKIWIASQWRTGTWPKCYKNRVREGHGGPGILVGHINHGIRRR